VIDATGVEIVNTLGRESKVQTLGIISKEQFISARLFDRQMTLRPDEIGRYRQAWSRLKQENAPLRVIAETGLVSAPITYFDDVLLSYATYDWRKGARIVGEAMTELWQGPRGQRVGDLLLWARVCALGEAGLLELRWDASGIAATEVRRSQKSFR
jgi:hypothetical protein